MTLRRQANGDRAIDPRRPRARGPARSKMVGLAQVHAHDRLRHLYEVSKLLTVFDDVEETVHAIVSNIADTLPLRSAVLVLGSSRNVRTLVWKAKTLGANGVQQAIENAQAAYPYLIGSAAVLGNESTASVHEIVGGRDKEADGTDLAPEGFILLPLAVGRRGIFGALQVEGATPFDESDLRFVNAVVNQLALAIDRRTAIEAAQAAEEAKLLEAESKRESAEHAARLQHFLAELSARIASSRGYQSVLETAAGLVVPFYADVCIVDDLADDGALRRIQVAIADGQTPDLAEMVRRAAPHRGLQTAQAQVLATRLPILIPDVDVSPEKAAQDPEHQAVLRAAGLLSIIAVPLLARGRQLGVLSLATAESGRRYDATDLSLVTEVARRIAMAMDNARLHERTERAVQQRQDVLAIVSHDLRNPLSTILMLSQLHFQTQSDAHNDRDVMDLIRRSAERMNTMINDLLDISSIDAGHLSIVAQPNVLGPIFSEAMEILRPTATAKGIHLGAQLPVGDVALLCDRARILQVLLNLVGNAIKFTPSMGSIHLSAETRGATVQVNVMDTGTGVAADILPHVFERYWQAGETASGGRGLGLYICKGIVEAHGGWLAAESTVGAGSTFSFVLPLDPK